MVPHIVFHIPAPDYSPGPELWESRACEGAPEVPTSGLTQPPVLATAVRVLHETVAGSVVPGGSRPCARAVARMAASRPQHDRRSDRHRPSVGGGRQLAALRPSAGTSRRRRRARLRAHGPPRDRLLRAADRQRLRPVSVPRTAAAGPGLPASVARGHAVRLRRSHLQLDPRPRRGRPCLACDRDRRGRGSGERCGGSPRPGAGHPLERLSGDLRGRRRRRRRRQTRPSTGSSLSMRACRRESRRAVSSRRRCGHRLGSALRPRRPGP